jgi:hypothetical protein
MATVEMRVEPLLPTITSNTFTIATQEDEGPKDNNTVVINIDQQIWVIPNVITASGATDNRVWHIPQLENGNAAKYHIEKARIEVYNTWGNMVYRANNYIGAVESGRGFTGDNLSKGTYYYYLTLYFDDGRPATLIKNYIMVLQ